MVRAWECACNLAAKSALVGLFSRWKQRDLELTHGAHNPASAGSAVQIGPPHPWALSVKCGMGPSEFLVMSRVSNKPYFVYVIWSDSSRRFYIGISENLAHRLELHNAGVSKWTSKFGPWRLVHAEQFTGYSGARKRELELKKQKGGEDFYKLIGRTFDDLTQREEQSDS